MERYLKGTFTDFNTLKVKALLTEKHDNSVYILDHNRQSRRPRWSFASARTRALCCPERVGLPTLLSSSILRMR